MVPEVQKGGGGRGEVENGVRGRDERCVCGCSRGCGEGTIGSAVFFCIAVEFFVRLARAQSFQFRLQRNEI